MTIVIILLSLGFAGISFLAQMYRNQRDDLATLLIQLHPELFPDLSSDD